MKVYSPKDLELYFKSGQQLRYPFTTYDGGIHKVCVINEQKFSTEFEFSIKTGIDAKDYTELVTKKNLKPAELEAEKIKDSVKELHKSMKRSSEIDIKISVSSQSKLLSCNYL